MKKILLLILLATLFIGCKKEDKNENYRIVGKWILTDIDCYDGTSTRCNFDGLIDEFVEDGKYFGFLPDGINKRQSHATYSLNGTELKLYWGEIEQKFEVLYLHDPWLHIKYVNYENRSILFSLKKHQ